MTTPIFDAHSTAVDIVKHYEAEATGRNVLITGVSPSSLGEETVKALAPYAKTIILASRTPSKIQEVIADVKKVAPSANLIPIEVDLSSPESVKKAASQINDLKLPIHLVLNNAGVTSAHYPQLNKTSEGVEIQIAANHFGHFLLTSRIFPSIKAAQTADYKPRIINVSSIAHGMGPPRLDDVTYQKRPEEYNAFGAYCSSKLANVLFSRGLAERYGDSILSYSLHPGNILETNMATAGKAFMIQFGLLAEDGSKKVPEDWKTIEEGSSTTVYAALSPSIVDQNGAYLADCALADDKASEASKSPENVKLLWEETEKLIGEKFGQAS